MYYSVGSVERYSEASKRYNILDHAIPRYARQSPLLVLTLCPTLAVWCKAATRKDSAGLLPLQVALRKDAVSEVVEAVAVAYPEAVGVPWGSVVVPGGEVYKRKEEVKVGDRVFLAPGIEEPARGPDGGLRAGVVATVVKILDDADIWVKRPPYHDRIIK